MLIREHIDELERQGAALAAAAERAGLEAVVVTCPGWTVRDLVAHTAGVHAWAAKFVRADQDADPRATLPSAAPDEDVVARYRRQHAALVAALHAAPADLATWSFLRAPSPLAFWARRQAHEAAIHRADAATAAGERVEYGRRFAADGIDEVLSGFFHRRSKRLHSERVRRLVVAPDDLPQRWLATIGPDGCHVDVGMDEPADCTVHGSASDIYLLLWNRPAEPVFEGDAQVLALWRARARITWT